MPDQGKAPWSDARYARIYATLSRDHPDVWDRDDLLAWYVRLLLRADQAWPGLPDLPRSVPDGVLDALVTDEVVDLIGAQRYRFHGLDQERNGQRRRGQSGGIVRASSAPRDPLGRFAGETNGNAGHSLDRSLDADAGDVRWTSSDPATDTPDTTRQDAHKRPGVVPAGKPTRAGAREEPDPSRVDCDDYQAHRSEHRWIDGSGWKCPVCEATRALSEPTFREKVERAGGAW